MVASRTLFAKRRGLSGILIPTDSSSATSLPRSAARNGIPKELIRRYSSFSSIQEYHERADETLESLLTAYEDLAEEAPEVDCDLAQGVMTLILPPIGTYVINKQPPNEQIWLSSPISGPKRYDWVDGKWVYPREQQTLGELLREETKQATGVDLNCDVL